VQLGVSAAGTSPPFLVEQDASEAIAIWESLLARGVDAIAADYCSEGRDWAESMINDCRFRLALEQAS
jgi:hypothetical protein